MQRLLAMARTLIDCVRFVRTVVEPQANKVRVRIYDGARAQVVLVSSDTPHIVVQIAGVNVSTVTHNGVLVVTCGRPLGKYVARNTGDARANGGTANTGISIGNSPLHAVDYDTAPLGETNLYSNRPALARVTIALGTNHTYAYELLYR